MHPAEHSGEFTSGEIIVDSDRLFVTADSSWMPLSTVEILALQPEGKKQMSAADFIRGHSLSPGDCFSNRPE